MNDYLFHALQLYILDCFLQKHIVCEIHCEKHFGRDKTSILLSTYNYWPKMLRHVSNFVKISAICQRPKRA